MNQPRIYIGVDVQKARSCPYAILGETGNWITSSWLPRGEPNEIGRALRGVVEFYAGGDESSVAVGIDAPRAPLPSPRTLYWNRSKSAWRACLSSDRGYGRHCEVIIAAHRFANPQWTPPAESARRWMKIGFALFDGLAGFPNLYEVFPSASYTQLSG